MADSLGIKPTIKHLAARKEVLHAFSDHSKVARDFNIQKYVDLQIGIERMVTWAKEIGPLPTKKFKNIEIYENLPPSWQKMVE